MKQLSKRVVPIIVLATGAIGPFGALADEAASYTMRFLTPETALRAAHAAIENCRDAGFQVSVAVVDRTGQVQVVLRDRFAGTHTPTAAVDKAWTAASFKISTSQLAEATQAGKASSGIRDIPRVLAVGGGMMIEVAGNIYGAIGVSGAPNGEAVKAARRLAWIPSPRISSFDTNRPSRGCLCGLDNAPHRQTPRRPEKHGVGAGSTTLLRKRRLARQSCWVHVRP